MQCFPSHCLTILPQTKIWCLLITCIIEPNNASPLNPDAARLWDNQEGVLPYFLAYLNFFSRCCRFQGPSIEALPPNYCGSSLRNVLLVLLLFLKFTWRPTLAFISSELMVVRTALLPRFTLTFYCSALSYCFSFFFNILMDL